MKNAPPGCVRIGKPPEQKTLACVERGFDTETGEQLFGTPPGESLLLGRIQ